eukprot:9379721-Alexandrium_andersonii.AAC.1
MFSNRRQKGRNKRKIALPAHFLRLPRGLPPPGPHAAPWGGHCPPWTPQKAPLAPCAWRCFLGGSGGATPGSGGGSPPGRRRKRAGSVATLMLLPLKP